MVEVSLFINGEHEERMERSTVPRVGETIVIDCGKMVKVIEVSYQWDAPDLVQINTSYPIRTIEHLNSPFKKL